MKKNVAYCIVCMMMLTSILSVGSIANKNLVNTNPKNILNYEDESWPMFHHNPQLTGFTSGEALDTNNQIWSVDLGEDIRFSSPAVVDNFLYIGTGEMFGTKQDEYIENYINNIGVLSILNHKFPKSKINREVSEFTSNGTLYCLNALNGQHIWNIKTSGNVYSCPVVSQGNVYAVSSDMFSFEGELYCIDAISGNINWNISVMTGYATPLVTDGKLYLAMIEPDDYFGELVCLDASTGELLWNQTLGYVDFSLYTSPAISENNLLITSVEVDDEFNAFCTMKCFNATTGEMSWNTRLGSMDFGYALSSPVIEGDIAYVINAETLDPDFWCELNCLDISNGSILWNYTMKAELDELSFASPAVGYGNVYFTSIGDEWAYGKIYCLDGESGELLWTVKSSDAYTLSSPVIAENKVYVGGFDMMLFKGQVLCYDAFDGELLFSSWASEEFIESTPAIAYGAVYIATIYGKVCAYRDIYEIGKISGGFARVKAEIINVGDIDIENVDCAMTVSGGMFGLINRTLGDTITLLKANSSETISISPVLGFGPIEINVQIRASTISSCIEKKNGFVFGPLIFVY